MKKKTFFSQYSCSGFGCMCMFVGLFVYPCVYDCHHQLKVMVKHESFIE